MEFSCLNEALTCRFASKDTFRPYHLCLVQALKKIRASSEAVWQMANRWHLVRRCPHNIPAFPGQSFKLGMWLESWGFLGTDWNCMLQKIKRQRMKAPLTEFLPMSFQWLWQSFGGFFWQWWKWWESHTIGYNLPCWRKPKIAKGIQ